MRMKISLSAACLRSHLEAGDLSPDLESSPTFPAIIRRLEPMAARAAVLTDRPVGSEKALRMAR